ncbi:MAG: acyl carrier protein [Alphaproteobacteria bacterium]
MPKNVSQQIYRVIAQECGVKAKAITGKTLFMSNPDFSYFDVVAALYTLQHELHVSLPESDYGKYETVGALTRNIIGQLKKQK